VFRRQPLNINHFALSAALLLIMGSLTLGVVDCKTDWSYDLGGAIGVACASDLLQAIGAGMFLVLFVGWILTGVFINHNFIRTVSNVSDKMVDKSGKILEGVKDFVVARKADDVEEEATDDAPAETPAMPATPELVAEEPREQEYVIPRPEPQYEIPPVAPSVPQSEERPMTMNEYLAAKRAAELGEPEDDGFVVIPKNKPEEQPVQPAQPVLERQDDDFTVIANPTVKPNPINVDVLLKRDEEDDGFVVIRPEENTEPEAPAVQEEPVVAPVVEDEDDGFVVISKEPKKSAAVVDDSDRIVVKVHENKVRQLDEDEIVSELYDPLRDLEHYKKPYVSLLEDYKSPHKVSDTEIYDNKCRIQETLKYFGIPIVDIDATVGPTVTLYEIKQAQGVKISKIQSLEKDIAQSLRAQGIRIIAPIPGKGTIGIEVPNRDKQIVSMYSSICSEEFQHAKMELPIVIGRTIQNENFTFDLAKLPHLLVAGATGQGKSVGLNAIITSLLYTKHPAQLKFVMIDPKMVEFSVYNKLERHFLAKMESEEESIITEPKKAVCVLNSLVEEMGRRLELLKMATSRNIVEYNEKFTARRLNPQKGHRFLPYIVVI
ncbi:MAG: DNA translocase FtsK, partial [Alistipes sp.]|nr:DNA translocase FtsK [Alistipes sp.]